MADRWTRGRALLYVLCALGCTGQSWSPVAEQEPGLDPGTKGIHRLNRAEYNATVADVLLTKLEPASASWREGELAGFDNMASVLGVDEEQYGRYFAAAKALASDVMESEERRARFVVCDLSEAGCFRTCLERAGLRLFRRPLTSEELDTYSKVYTGALTLGDAPSDAFQLVLQALLSSLQFLYRVELDSADTARRAHELDGFELASRLSYFLWSSAPDDALLQAAADGTLREEANLVASVERMLGDPRAARFVERFAGQWLGARLVLSHPVSTDFYRWSPEVARAAGEEMTLYFEEFLRTDRSWLEFPKADVNFVTEGLSYLYGIDVPVGPRVRVEHSADGRAGFFGLAGFLALSSFDRRTSPSLRGRWISSNLLCAEPPPPPQNVPTLGVTGSATEAANVRQVLEQHRQNPGCSGCHELFDPYGIALEEYDAIGQHRTAYEDGSPVDVTARLPASEHYPEGLSFEGSSGLAEVVAADPRFGACLAQKLLTYGLGRTVTPGDAPVLTALVERWRAPGAVPSVRRLIRELVLSEAFRFRRAEGSP